VGRGRRPPVKKSSEVQNLDLGLKGVGRGARGKRPGESGGSFKKVLVLNQGKNVVLGGGSLGGGKGKSNRRKES